MCLIIKLTKKIQIQNLIYNGYIFVQTMHQAVVEPCNRGPWSPIARRCHLPTPPTYLQLPLQKPSVQLLALGPAHTPINSKPATTDSCTQHLAPSHARSHPSPMDWILRSSGAAAYGTPVPHDLDGLIIKGVLLSQMSPPS